jgi:hypothetical protein
VKDWRILIFLLWTPLLGFAQTSSPAAGSERPLASLAEEISSIELDPAQCYRVRDLPFGRGELRLYYNDGWLIFAKPIAGRRVAALFVGSDLGDAEIVLVPPSAGERRSLARFTGAPNLSEHADSVMMLFTDNTGDDLMESLRVSGSAPVEERGLMIRSQAGDLVRNLTASFVLRIIESLATGRKDADGFLYLGLAGRKLGTFDAMFDPSASQQVFVGRLATKDDRTFYDVWTHFATRSANGPTPPAPVYRIERTKIEANLQPDLNMRVHSALSVSIEKPTRVLLFELSKRLSISKVTVDGEDAEFFEPDSIRSNLMRLGEISQFLIKPKHALDVGSKHEVVIDYDGQVVTKTTPNVYTVGARSSWYPSNGIQFSRFDITFTYPSDLDLVFPGTLREESIDGGRKTTHRVIEQPVRLAGFNLGRYEHVEASRRGFEVRLYANREVEAPLRVDAGPIVISTGPGIPGRGIPGVGGRRADVVILPPPPPPDPLARLRNIAEEVAGAFEFFSQRFGPPVLNELNVAPIPGAFGQGFPGIIYLSTLAYLTPSDRPSGVRESATQLFFSETLHAHETAHQWWGNVVVTQSEADDWLMEALASYSSLLMLEKRKGPKDFKNALEQYRTHLLENLEGEGIRDSIGPLSLGSRLDNSLAPGTWQTIIYEKGAWAIHMLRRYMGDAAFFAFLKNFTEKNRLRTVTTEDFRRAAASFLPKGAADRNLESFFETWVYGTGIPSLRLETSYRGKAPNLQLILKLTQSDVGDRFTAQVPVELQTAAGKKQVVWMETGAVPSTLTLPVAQRPTRVSLDPENSVLHR